MTLLQAKAIWIDAPQKMNRYVWLMPPAPLKTAKTIAVRIASSVPYQLFVNGKLHSYGPWRGSRNLVFVTTHTVRPDSPETRIAFLAHHPARPSSEMDMGSPWLMAECRDASGKILASTDGHWCASEAEGWKRSVPSSWFLRGMAEVFHCSGSGQAPAVPALGMPGTAKELPEMILDGIHFEQEEIARRRVLKFRRNAGCSSLCLKSGGFLRIRPPQNKNGPRTAGSLRWECGFREPWEFIPRKNSNTSPSTPRL